MSARAGSSAARAYLIDAGPLIALIDRDERHHAWVREALNGLEAPLLTCESVLSEAWFLARRGGLERVLLGLLSRLPLRVVPAWGPRTLELLEKYRGRASVADASLLALAEAEGGRVVVTLDVGDFSVYRIHGRQAVPALMPPL